MKTRILKKVSERVRIVKYSGMWLVQTRKQSGWKSFDSWFSISSCSSHKKAIEKRNIHIVMVIMRDLGHRNEFVKRRTKRKKNREKR